MLELTCSIQPLFGNPYCLELCMGSNYLFIDPYLFHFIWILCDMRKFVVKSNCEISRVPIKGTIGKIRTLQLHFTPFLCLISSKQTLAIVEIQNHAPWIKYSLRLYLEFAWGVVGVAPGWYLFCLRDKCTWA